MIKAVIYDFDDTLVDSDPLHTQSWQQNLTEHHIQDISDFIDFRKKNMMGKSSRENARLLVNHYKINADPESFYKRKNEIYMENAISKIKLLPGAIYSLDLLKKACLRLAVASSSDRKYLETIIKKLNLNKYFELIISADEIQKSKPDPQTFIVACNELNLKPSECVVIEDAAVGVKSAKAAGCKCIAIPNIHVSQNCSEADLVIDSLENLNLKEVLCL